MTPASGRVLLHLSRDLRRAIEADDISYLEAVGQATLVHQRSARTLRDVRSLGELVPLFAPFGILRVHRNHAVNVRHVLEIRRRDSNADWEIKLDPPVNRVLPVSRSLLKRLWAAFGER